MSKMTAINRIFRTISYREREILKLRIGCDGFIYTLEEVGQIFKKTRERVRQIEKKALRKLRRGERAEEIEEKCGSIPASDREFKIKLAEWTNSQNAKGKIIGK